jgi:hypothetical protein
MKKLLQTTILTKALPAVLAVWAIGLTACEKVIDIDLNAADPAIVIEGNVTDQPGPYTVSLTRTVNFDELNHFPPVTGATVTLNDNAGNAEVLTETMPGLYQTNTLQGVPGREYFLKVEEGANLYTSVSRMPFPVAIDTIVIETLQFSSRHQRKIVRAKFRDPADIVNFYRLIITVRDTVRTGIYLTRDDFSDGEEMSSSFYDNDFQLKSGDVIKVDLLSITEDVSQYFRSLLQAGGGGQSASPANPPSNITHGALGVFSAHSVTTKTITVP